MADTTVVDLPAPALDKESIKAGIGQQGSPAGGSPPVAAHAARHLANFAKSWPLSRWARPADFLRLWKNFLLRHVLERTQQIGTGSALPHQPSIYCLMAQR
jgi:hypothetical protein